jgi:hypothetical protein
MNPVLQELGNPAGYDTLPEPIKTLYSPREYAWLSDAEKARLVITETEPDTD